MPEPIILKSPELDTPPDLGTVQLAGVGGEGGGDAVGLPDVQLNAAAPVVPRPSVDVRITTQRRKFMSCSHVKSCVNLLLTWQPIRCQVSSKLTQLLT